MCSIKNKSVFLVVVSTGLCAIFSAVAMQPSFSSVVQQVSPIDQLKMLHDRLVNHIPPSKERDITFANLRAAIDHFGRTVRGDESYKKLVRSWCYSAEQGFNLLCRYHECPWHVKSDAATVMVLLSQAMTQKYPVVQQQPQQRSPVAASPVHHAITPVQQIVTSPSWQPITPVQRAPARPVVQPLHVTVPPYRDGSPIGSGPTNSLQAISPIVSGPANGYEPLEVSGSSVHEALRTKVHAGDSRADVPSPFFSPFFEPDAQR